MTVLLIVINCVIFWGWQAPEEAAVERAGQQYARTALPAIELPLFLARHRDAVPATIANARAKAIVAPYSYAEVSYYPIHAYQWVAADGTRTWVRYRLSPQGGRDQRPLGRFEGRDRLGDLGRGARFHLLGTSGTVTTLAGLHLGLARYDRRMVDGLWMDDLDVERMIDRLLGWKFEERVANACIGADRADLVLAGCAILEAIRRVWPSGRLRVADRGLREGILSELMSEDGAWRRNGQRQW